MRYHGQIGDYFKISMNLKHPCCYEVHANTALALTKLWWPGELSMVLYMLRCSLSAPRVDFTNLPEK